MYRKTNGDQMGGTVKSEAILGSHWIVSRIEYSNRLLRLPHIHSFFPRFTYRRRNGDQMGGTVKTWQSLDAESTASCFSTLQKHTERKTQKTFEQIQIPENTQKEENDTKQTWPNRAVHSARGKA